MYKVFNTGALTRNQRFVRALICGIGAMAVLSVAYGLLTRLIMIQFSAAFIGVGWLIGMTIQKAGHGVQIQFAVLGAVLTFLSIMFGDIISLGGIGAIFSPEYYAAWIRMLMSTNINSLLSLLFRVVGIYMGFVTSRVV